MFQVIIPVLIEITIQTMMMNKLSPQQKNIKPPKKYQKNAKEE